MALMRLVPLFGRRLPLAAAVIQAGMVGLTLICAMMLYQAHEAARLEAIGKAESLARVLQGGVENNVQIVDLSLRNVAADLALLEEHQLPTTLRTQVLANDALPTQAIGALLVLDEAGHILFDSLSRTTKDLDLSSRGYFLTHRDHPEAGLTLSLLPSSRLSGKPVLLLTRRINHPDGSFGGVAAEIARRRQRAALLRLASRQPPPGCAARGPAGQRRV